MKKYYAFIIIIIIIVLGYFLITSSPSSYELKYKQNGFEIKEIYNSDIDSYSVLLTKDGKDYPFAIKHKYSKKRKIVSNINEIIEDSSVCVSVKLFDEGMSPVCNINGVLVDGSINENVNDELIQTKSNIEIYNNDHIYFVWNGYGFTDLLSNKKFNVLKKESYDNVFSYCVDNYIMFANYDDDYKYSKLYIFDMKNKSYEEMTLDIPIDKDSYILGNLEYKIYVFDRKVSKEYVIDIKKQNIETVSNTDGGFIYLNGEKQNIPLAKLKYDNYKFSYLKPYSYTSDNYLYLYYYGIEDRIKVSNNKVKAITQTFDDEVYYISDNSLYQYSIKTKNKKLLTNFEWNFSFDNKVFVYNK